MTRHSIDRPKSGQSAVLEQRRNTRKTTSDSIHRIVFAVDIEGFGGPSRKDPERSRLREELGRQVKACLRHAGLSTRQFALSDLGDGILCVIDGGAPKTRLIESIQATLATSLRQYNRMASISSQLRLRVAVHAGDISRDKDGFFGEEMNFAFRLLDSPAAKHALSTTDGELILIISDYIFSTVVRHEYGSVQAPDFSPVDVENKETRARAWLWSTPTGKRKKKGSASQTVDGTQSTKRAAGAGPERKARTEATRRQVRLADLTPAAVYLSTGDTHNCALYAHGGEPTPLENQLETALLLAHEVVLHCADPLRSPRVMALASEYVDMIEEGRILFLLGDTAQDPGRHFDTYIETKIDQYARSKFGDQDVESLRTPSQEEVRATVALLSRSPFALTRGFSGTAAFIDAAREEMRVGERIATSDAVATSHLMEAALSVRQILDLCRINERGRPSRIVGDDKKMETLLRVVNECSSHNSFSRNIWRRAIMDCLGMDKDSDLYDLVTSRIHRVHLKATLGGFPFTEFTRTRERQSLYSYQALLEHAASLAASDLKPRFGAALVRRLRKEPLWEQFASLHIRIMAESRTLSPATRPSRDVSALFAKTRESGHFKSIARILSDAWGRGR